MLQAKVHNQGRLLAYQVGQVYCIPTLSKVFVDIQVNLHCFFFLTKFNSKLVKKEVNLANVILEVELK